MYATLINAFLILVGSLLGLAFKSRISTRFTDGLTHALGLCVLGIGITSAVTTKDTLCVIICMVLGTLLGELIRIEDRLDSLGGLLQKKLLKGGGGRFSEGFMNASVLFCVGAMAITGSLNAGLTGDGSILISKGVIDGVTSITFASAMGVGVAFSIVPLILYQGGLTLLASVVGPYLDAAVVGEMSAVGGVIIMGIAINMLGLGKSKIKVGNMLPAIFLPLAYVPVASWLGGLF
ncbi:MAG: DUF554 domain-containing protein [Clostridia bacterium]|nr:DUF554 domain-containing protein [Clostridia bacterium]